MTQDDPKRYRRRYTHPYATLLALLPAAGVVAWLFTGEWRWAILGLLSLFAAAAVGTSIDGAKRKRGDR